jgi:hypothetical protein
LKIDEPHDDMLIIKYAMVDVGELLEVLTCSTVWNTSHFASIPRHLDGVVGFSLLRSAYPTHIFNISDCTSSSDLRSAYIVSGAEVLNVA